MEAELIQITLALHDWNRFGGESRKAHARAQDMKIAYKGGETAAIMIRDLQDDAVRAQGRALECLGRAIDALNRMPQDYRTVNPLHAQLEHHLQRTLVDYMALLELAGLGDVSDLTRAVWLQASNSDVIRRGIAAAFPLPPVQTGEATQRAGEAAHDASAAMADREPWDASARAADEDATT